MGSNPPSVQSLISGSSIKCLFGHLMMIWSLCACEHFPPGNMPPWIIYKLWGRWRPQQLIHRVFTCMCCCCTVVQSVSIQDEERRSDFMNRQTIQMSPRWTENLPSPIIHLHSAWGILNDGRGQKTGKTSDNASHPLSVFTDGEGVWYRSAFLPPCVWYQQITEHQHKWGCVKK